MGGIRIGSRNNTFTSGLPTKLRRARAYAAGTPSTTDSTTTASDTCNVTSNTSSRFISCQAVAYQDVVSPAGHQVPNHCLENEFTTTEITSANTLSRKNATTPHVRHLPRDSVAELAERTSDTVIPCLPSRHGTKWTATAARCRSPRA